MAILTDAADLLYRQVSPQIAELEQPAVAILNAEPHPTLKGLATATDRLEVQQHLRASYRVLEADGMHPVTHLSDHDFDLILLLPGKQREQNLGRMAQAMRQLKTNGRLLVCCPNTMGAKSYEKRLHELAGNIAGSSKSKCRCFSACRTPALDSAIQQAWIDAAAVQRMPQSGLYSQPGLFSWDRSDPGSNLLLAHLPSGLAGRGMDLGCGYGYLSVQALKRFPDIHELHAVDTDRLALDCTAMNLKPFTEHTWHTHWLDATQEPLPDNLDWVLLNPPFHSGQQQDTGLGQAIIDAACRSLRPGGRLFLVANRHLPYESVLCRQLRHFTTLKQEAGFKVIEGEQ